MNPFIQGHKGADEGIAIGQGEFYQVQRTGNDPQGTVDGEDPAGPDVCGHNHKISAEKNCKSYMGALHTVFLVGMFKDPHEQIKGNARGGKGTKNKIGAVNDHVEPKRKTFAEHINR